MKEGREGVALNGTVSVIIPSVGRRTVQETEAALKTQSRMPDEILVILDTEGRGPSWARNKGFEKARGDFIAFIDDDCVPDKDWLECFVRAMDEQNAAMVSSHYRESDPFLHEIRMRRNFPQSMVVNPDQFVGISGNVLYRRACLEECLRKDGHVFNPLFKNYASEDLELVWRLRKRGHKLVFVPNEVKHLKRMTPTQYLQHQFNRGVGLGILYGIQKGEGGPILPDQGLLWHSKEAKGGMLKWVAMFWKKILGPFDRQSFSSFQRFAVFWMGEKTQAAGFLFCLFSRRAGRL